MLHRKKEGMLHRDIHGHLKLAVRATFRTEHHDHVHFYQGFVDFLLQSDDAVLESDSSHAPTG